MGVNIMSEAISHSQSQLLWIKKSLKSMGIKEYRFCVENDCYICDIDGNFYSVCVRRHSTTGNLIEKYAINKLKGSIDRDGYKTYRITTPNGRKHLKGHRMMLNAWIGENKYLSVNHKDGNKTNNKLSNLEWVTTKENNIHAINSGLRSMHTIRTDGLYRIPRYDWMSIYVLNKHSGYSITKIAKENQCSRPVIGDVIKRIDSILPEVIKNA